MRTYVIGVWGLFLSECTFLTSPKTASHARHFFENLELLKNGVGQKNGFIEKPI